MGENGEAVWKRARETRERLNLSKSWVGRLVRLTDAAVTQYEQGLSGGMAPTHVKMLDAVYVKLDELLEAAR